MCRFILSSILPARDCFFISSYTHNSKLYALYLAVPLLDQKSGPIHSCEVCLPFLYQSLLNCYLHNSKLHMFVLFYLPLRTKIDKYIDFYSCQSWTIRNCSLISRLSG
jgi:hypothetical protein